MAISAKVKAMLAEANIVETSNMDGIQSGVPRISLRKSRFTLKGGDEDIQHTDDTLNVVILSISPNHGFTHTYYIDGYTPGAADAPDCTSLDGIRPTAQTAEPQADLCRKCPQQVWGSARSMSGGKAKACKDSKHLYVKIADDLDNPEAPVYLLNVTIMSLKAFGAYGKWLYKNEIPTPAIVITQLGFDEEADVPVLTFTSLGLLDDESCELAIEQSTAQTEEVRNMIALAASTDEPRASAKAIKSGTKLVEQELKPKTDEEIDNITERW